MTALKLKLNDSNLDQLVNYLIKERKFDYENHSQDMSILISHNARLIDMTFHVNMVIIKKEGPVIYIDVITAGGDVLLDFNAGVEKGYIRENSKVVYEYAELYELRVEQL
jgi:hypothetical protein